MADRISTVFLTGAGFSVPWGAPLARQLNPILFNRSVSKTPRIAEMILKDLSFEEALHKLRSIDVGEAEAFEFLLRETFEEIDRDMIYLATNSPHNSFSANLALLLWQICEEDLHCGATSQIFTLNLDIGFERFWANMTAYGVHFSKLGFSSDLSVNGISNFGGANLDALKRGEPFRSHPIVLERPTDGQQGVFTYTKLHGSFTWNDASGKCMIIAGLDKDQLIPRFEILRRSWISFVNALESTDLRLVVIGYSFCDPHINQQIWSTSTNFGNQVIIVDPNATALARQHSITTARIPVDRLLLYDATIEDLVANHATRTGGTLPARSPLARSFWDVLVKQRGP